MFFLFQVFKISSKKSQEKCKNATFTDRHDVHKPWRKYKFHLQNQKSISKKHKYIYIY